MSDPVSLQSLFGLNALQQSETSSTPIQRTLLPFPMQNLALTAQPDQSLPASTSESQNKLSLSAQSLATIITNAVIKTVQAMMSLFIEKLLPALTGQQTSTTGETGTATSPTTVGTAAPGTTSTDSVDDAPSTSAPSATSGTTKKEEGSFLDGVKGIFKNVTNFLFGENANGISIFKDILTTFIPGGTFTNLLSKFTGLDKVVSGLLTLGKGTLGKVLTKGTQFIDSIFPGSSTAIKGLVDKGKSFLKKIF
ncbi:MAG: hypothetical protein J0M12_16230 [Deltaproteobacteria bacterium]|nr:hypothetical protein [Deltaproteobacteria bacterium]